MLEKCFQVINQGSVSVVSCIHQLVSIIHEIYNTFDANPSLEVRDVFLDIFKAFESVWPKDLLCQIKCMGINENFLKLVESVLSARYQRVALNGQASTGLMFTAQKISCGFGHIYWRNP